MKSPPNLLTQRNGLVDTTRRMNERVERRGRATGERAGCACAVRFAPSQNAFQGSSQVQRAEEEVRQAFVLHHQVHGDAGEGESHPVRVPAEMVTLRVVQQLGA